MAQADTSNDSGLECRPMSPADYPYVISTWLHSAAQKFKHHRGVEMTKMRPGVEAALTRGRVLCVVNPDETRTVHGWICTELGGELLYIFVPKELKNSGIEELLWKTAAAKPAAEECA